MNNMTTEEYEKVCGNIAEMGEEEFTALFNLMLYERVRRYYDVEINSPRNFSGSWTHQFGGGHGQLSVVLMETVINQGLL